MPVPVAWRRLWLWVSLLVSSSVVAGSGVGGLGRPVFTPWPDTIGVVSPMDTLGNPVGADGELPADAQLPALLLRCSRTCCEIRRIT
ncbi:hypothetical protein [Amycolatopsis pigmentata]|uniref:Uncharacterized protein n=1 Tax=Amycolatopsis pigmentata TaxID=450801 RepID=A0ABW5G596_9PSEU